MINRDHDINQVSHGINYKTTIKFPPTTKTPAFTSVILFNYSTSEKRSYRWQILRISIPPLIKYGHVFQQQQKVLGTIIGLIHCPPKLLSFFTFSTIKRGKIKIQTKHKYTYRTNTKQKLAFSCNIFRLFALLLTKTCLRSHWHVHDCYHLPDGDAHGMINIFCARFWISRWISPTINKFSCKFCILIKYLT